MSIRQEAARDKSRIATLIARTYLSEGASTVEQTGILRSLDTYLEKLAFVFEAEGSVDAYALFTPVNVAGASGAVMLAPFAVDTKKIDFDVAGFLMSTFEKVSLQGIRYVFVLGNLDDLAALGFKFAEDCGFTLTGNPPVSLLVKDLGAGAELKGEVTVPEILLS
tara:strand:+ start:213631 stop:214125 length:495 start_codon:yes stop_codon:yes gene_type:complete